MKRILLPLILGTALAVGCADKIQSPSTPPSDDPTSSGTPTIVYNRYDLSSSSKLGEVIIADEAGAEVSNVATGGTWGSAAGKIIYAKGTGTAFGTDAQIIVANNDGSDPVVAIDFSSNPTFSDGRYRLAQWPVISPDAKRIAFIVVDTKANSVFGEFLLYVANADGTGLKGMSNEVSSKSTPCFSPDGTKLAYYEIPKGGLSDRVEIMDVVHGVPKTIAYSASPNDDNPAMIAWSVNNKIIYENGSGQTLYMTDPDGTEPVLIGNGRNPSWSADGSKLAFTDENGEIVVTEDMGLTLTKVTNTPTMTEIRPEWSPDGTKILCTQRNSSTTAQDPSNALKVIDLTAGTEDVIATPAFGGFWLK